MQWNEMQTAIAHRLTAVYDAGEAAAMARLLCAHYKKEKTGTAMVNASDKQALENAVAQLLQHKPLQYILGEAWFYKWPFRVNEAVLIPRPETEELVEWIVQEEVPRWPGTPRVLDVGTGSGCIAIALQLEWNAAAVTAVDVSDAALEVAAENAKTLGATVQLLPCNFANTRAWHELGYFEVMVSNPPYIAQSEAHGLDAQVVQYEPHTALFVPDDDPLLFYRLLAGFGKEHLVPGGSIYVELNQRLAEATRAVFEDAGYASVELKKDMSGNFRMLRARL